MEKKKVPKQNNLVLKILPKGLIIAMHNKICKIVYKYKEAFINYYTVSPLNLYSLQEIHNPLILLRPIITFRGFHATYNKRLTRIYQFIRRCCHQQFRVLD